MIPSSIELAPHLTRLAELYPGIGVKISVSFNDPTNMSKSESLIEYGVFIDSHGDMRIMKWGADLEGAITRCIEEAGDRSPETVLRKKVESHQRAFDDAQSKLDAAISELAAFTVKQEAK